MDIAAIAAATSATSETFERQYETRTLALKAEMVKVGDLIPAQQGSNFKAADDWSVTEVKVGRKWVYITAEKAGRPDVTRKFEVELGYEIQVGRSFETEESKAAYHAAALECWTLNSLNSWKPTAPDALAKVAKAIGNGHAASSFEISALIEAQADDAIWGNFVVMIGRAMENGKTVTEAREIYCEMLRKRIIDRAGYGTSRSTSAVSNAMEDSESAAMARFLRTY